MKQPKLTLLTCTHNGERTIQYILEAIANQTDVSKDIFEVVIVDNASTDRTSEIADATIKNLNLNGRVLLEPRLGKINAFLKGIDEARGELISIIDDDNFIKPGFIRYTLEVFEKYPDVGIVGSLNSILTTQALPSWFKWSCGYYACSPPYLSEPKNIDQDGIVLSKSGFIPGAGSTFRVKPLLDCLDRGYSFFNDTQRGRNMTTGEDLEVSCLISATGYRFAYNPRIQIDHAIKSDRLNVEYFKILCKTMGAGSLGIDPFLFTYKFSGEKWPLKWTWQWQLFSKFKQYLYLLLMQLFSNFDEEKKFINWRERVKIRGAIQRIISEQGNYTKHIHQIACGKWTELRVR